MPAYMYMEAVQPPEAAVWNCRKRNELFPLASFYYASCGDIESAASKADSSTETEQLLSSSTINNTKHKTKVQKQMSLTNSTAY